MNNPKGSYPKLATSCLLFDSPKFEKILLIERENEPEKGLWCFPGGNLDPGESVKEGMEREVYEETGYKVSIVENTLFNVTELKEHNFLILTGMAFLKDATPSTQNRIKKDLDIVTKFFSLDENSQDSVWNLKDEKCIQNLKSIIKRFLATYKKEDEKARETVGTA